MERIHYRSTSLIELQAELHQRALLAEAEERRRRPVPARRITFLWIPLIGKRNR